MGGSIAKDGLTEMGGKVKSGKSVLVSNCCRFMGVKHAGLETGLKDAGIEIGSKIGQELSSSLSSTELGESLHYWAGLRGVI